MRNPFPPLDKARDVFCRIPEIQAVYLFGSAVTGRLRAESDLDLGACFAPEAQVVPRLQLLEQLAAAGFDRVDLVYLHEADPALRYEIVRHNRLLYQTAGFDRGEVYSNVLRCFFDLQPLLARQRAALKKRLLHGTP